MSLRCPVCRADNSTPPNCRRCRADLSDLWSLEVERERRLEACRRAAGAGHGAEILRQATSVQSLRRGEDADLYRAWGHLLNHDFFDAFSCLVTARNKKLLERETAERT